MGRVDGRRWGQRGGRWDPRIPSAFAAPIGFAVTLLAAAVLSALRHHLSTGVDLSVMSGLIVICSWWMAWGGALSTAGLAWLMFNGFIASNDQTLHWHGTSDILRLCVLFGSAVAIGTLRSTQLRVRLRRELRLRAGPFLVLTPVDTLTRSVRRA